MEEKPQRGILSYRAELIEVFMNSICPCQWILVGNKHKKKDCPHYTFFLEKELLREQMEKFMKAVEKLKKI